MTMVLFQLVLVLVVISSVSFIRTVVAQTTPTTTQADFTEMGKYLALASALAVGLSVLGAGIAIKTTGTAAISTLSENENNFFKAFLVVALGEALAVYGLIVAILLWTKIPTPP
jgi:V/A-type H+-transporting ATPase subunit K